MQDCKGVRHLGSWQCVFNSWNQVERRWSGSCWTLVAMVIGQELERRPQSSLLSSRHWQQGSFLSLIVKILLVDLMTVQWVPLAGPTRTVLVFGSQHWRWHSCDWLKCWTIWRRNCWRVDLVTSWRRRKQADREPRRSYRRPTHRRRLDLIEIQVPRNGRLPRDRKQALCLNTCVKINNLVWCHWSWLTRASGGFWQLDQVLWSSRRGK